MGKETLALYAGLGQEGFRVEDFRNVEISQIKALANVLYNEDLVSDWEFSCLFHLSMAAAEAMPFYMK